MIQTAIQAFCDMMKQIFSTHQTEIEHTLDITVVRDKKNLKKACDYAEKLILITDKYIDNMSKTDLKKYNTNKNKFFKYN